MPRVIIHALIGSEPRPNKKEHHLRGERTRIAFANDAGDLILM